MKIYNLVVNINQRNSEQFVDMNKIDQTRVTENIFKSNSQGTRKD
jgi:hypothetical protein